MSHDDPFRVRPNYPAMLAATLLGWALVTGGVFGLCSWLGADCRVSLGNEQVALSRVAP